MRGPIKLIVFLALRGVCVCSLLGHTVVQPILQNFGRRELTFQIRSEKSDAGRHCEISGTQKITIRCTYEPAFRSSTRGPERIPVVLSRAEFAFGTVRDNHMSVVLTFANGSTRPIPAVYAVFLAVDDEAGHNVFRRFLPKVDFSKLLPGSPVAFSERLLIGGLRPGRYRISLVIPNPEASLKGDPARNLLLNNLGIADPAIGLNTLAYFSVGQ